MRDKYAELLVGKVIDALTKVRKDQGISHEKLAAKTGLSRSAISFIESHKRTPTLLSCVKLAKALGVRFSDLLDDYEK